MHVYKRGGRYWLEFRREGKRYRESLRTGDASVARVKAAARLAEVELQGAGLEYSAARRRPISELVPSYEADMRRRALGNEYVNEVLSKLARLVGHLDAGENPLLEKWTSDRLSIALAKIAAENTSSRTQNKIHLAASGFSRYLVGARLLQFNPCEGIAYAKYVPEAVRLNLEPEQLRQVLELKSLPLYRAAVYITAAATALRRDELGTRAPEHVNLDEATIAIEARDAKGEKDDVLPLPPNVVAYLRRYVAERAAGTLWLPRNARKDRFFCVPTLATFYKDLAAAGIPKETPAGYVDFHSLRVTAGTMLARAKVGLTLAQKLMRHSDPRLTANVYTRHQDPERRGAVDAASALWAKACPKPSTVANRRRRGSHARKSPKSSPEKERPPP